MPTTPPRTPGDKGCRPKVRIHKFDDRNRNGQLDPGERMLEGLPFDLVELRPGEPERVHQRSTDAEGRIEIEFPGPTRLRVRELLRQTGGRWSITTDHLRGADGMWYISPPGARTLAEAEHGGDCDDLDLWVGNAPPFLPRTGAGGGLPGSSQRVADGLRFD